jgi:hypothetical protein
MRISDVTKRFLLCLDKLLEEGKIRSKRQFALSIGYHAQGITEMAACRRDVPLSLIEKAVARFHFNPHYLFSGKGGMFSETGQDDGLRIRNLSIVTDQRGEERIVHVPYPAQAGYGKLLDDPVYMQELPTYQLPDQQFKSGSYRSFEIAGSSMEPTFRQSDIVIAAFIEPRYWEQALKNGQLYIIVTRQEVVIKRITNRIKAEKIIDCNSDNPDFETYSIPVTDILEIWKVRMKLTSHFEAGSPQLNNSDISKQLKTQQRMLEDLQQHLNISLVH